jgi:hypothetical protein
MKLLRVKKSMTLEGYELDFMDKLWEAANRLRGKMEAS